MCCLPSYVSKTFGKSFKLSGLCFHHLSYKEINCLACSSHSSVTQFNLCPCMSVFSTAIHTAAMDMLGGSGVESQCRKVDIMADAAYCIFKKPKTFTGNFIIDENILKEEGIKNFDVYAITPGNAFSFKK